MSVDSFLETQKVASEERRDREHDLWRKWNKGGRTPELLEPLLTSFEPLVQQKTRMWKAPDVPVSAFRANMHKHIIKALETYNPDRGASLTTHVNYRVRHSQRFVNKNQNMAYIPEEKTRHIGDIIRAETLLTEEMGAPPTNADIADHLNLPLRVIDQVQMSRRKDVAGSKLQSSDNDPMQLTLSRDREIENLLEFSLNPDQLAVFEHLTGRNGKQQISSTGELAKKLGKSAPQVSKIKTQLLEMYQKYR